MDTNGFVIYKDYREYFGFLTKEETADVMIAVMDYAFNGGEDADTESMTAAAALAYALIRNRIDRDREKYEKAATRSRKNGALGGRPPKTRAAEEEKECTEDSEVAEAEETEESESPEDRKSSCGEGRGEEVPEGFLRFWEEYPKKTGREKALSWFLENSPVKSELDLMMDALRRKKRSEGWLVEQGRYVPKAASWLEGREWRSTSGAPANAHPGGSFDTDDFFEEAVRRGLGT